MKLNTLLLTSAATLMATSVAFAADLPSKKAAPSSGSVQVCKVGGMTGFTLPGSDTCLGISGRVRFDATYNLDSVSDDSTLDWNSWGGSAQARFDARSNTEIGVVRSFLVLDGNNADGVTVDRAYVQFAGITAGRKDSIASVLGTQSDAFTLSDREEEGIDYQVAVGGLNFGIGLEAPNNNNDDGESADNPDAVVHLSGKVGDIGFAVAGVAHQAIDDDGVDTANGYAFLGNVNYTVNGLRLGVFGGTATNASEYTGGHVLNDGDQMYDIDNANDLDTQMYGVSAMYSAGKLTIGAEWAHYDADQTGAGRDTALESIETDQLAVFAGYQVAKNLTLYAEYFQATTDAIDDDGDTFDEESNTVLFRIQRDF